MTEHTDEDGVVHSHGDCPGDDWTACHDGVIYEPCGSEFCNGADTYVGPCACRCHDVEMKRESL